MNSGPANSGDPIKVINANLRSASNKVSQLKLFLETEKPDIMGITETWLKDKHTTSQFLAVKSGYAMYRSDRTRSGGGGVAILISLMYSCKMVECCANDIFEGLVLDIVFPIKMRLIIVYFAPSSLISDSETLVEFLSLYSCCTFPVIILGDFNLPDIDWSVLSARNGHSEVLVQFCINSMFHQVVDFPTRKNNILDLVMVNEPDMVKSVKSLPPFCGGDHSLISVFLLVSNVRSQAN